MSTFQSEYWINCLTYSVVPGWQGQQTEPQWNRSCTCHQRPVSDSQCSCHSRAGRANKAPHSLPRHKGDHTHESYCRPALHTPTHTRTQTNCGHVAIGVDLPFIAFDSPARQCAFVIFWEVLWFLPDSLGLSTHSPLQTTRCHSWCHKSGRHLSCLKQVYLKHIRRSVTATRLDQRNFYE